MSIGFRALIAAMSSHAESLGVFDKVGRHEPANAPGNGLHAAFWVDRVRPDPSASGLDVTTAVVVVQARLTTSVLSEPADDIDVNLMDALDLLMEAYTGDFTLGGLAMHVDLLGRSKVELLRSEAGYLPQDGQVFRAFMLWVPVVVTNAWNQAP